MPEEGEGRASNNDFFETTPRIWGAIKQPFVQSCQEEKSILQVIV
jgi:hypothetical protein